MAVYPNSIVAFTTKTNKVDLVDASHINTLQDEVTAIETELGKNVKGTATDLKTRLSKTLADNGALAQGTSFPVSPLDGQIFYRTDQDTFFIFDGSLWDSFGSNSNVIYAWSGKDDADSSKEVYKGSLVTPTTSPSDNLFYRESGTNTYNEFFRSRWTKIAGVATITVHARIWTNNTAITGDANVKVEVGTATGNGGRAANSPGWITPFTIDVSGLVNGTTYDIVVSGKTTDGSNNGFCYLSGICLLGS